MPAIIIAAVSMAVFMGLVCFCHLYCTTKNKSDLERDGSSATSTENSASHGEGQNQQDCFHYDVRGQIVNRGTERVPDEVSNTASRTLPPSYDATRQRIVHQVSRHSQLPIHNSSTGVPQPPCSSQHTEGAQGQAGSNVSRPSFPMTGHQLVHQVPRQSQYPSHSLCSRVTQPPYGSQQAQGVQNQTGDNVSRPSLSTNGQQTVHQAPRSSPCSTHTPFTLEAPPSYDSIFGQAVYSPLQVHSAADQRHQLSITMTS